MNTPHKKHFQASSNEMKHLAVVTVSNTMRSRRSGGQTIEIEIQPASMSSRPPILAQGYGFPILVTEYA